MIRSLNDPWFVLILGIVIGLLGLCAVALVTGGNRKPMPPAPRYPMRWDDETADRIHARIDARARYEQEQRRSVR